MLTAYCCRLDGKQKQQRCMLPTLMPGFTLYPAKCGNDESRRTIVGHSGFHLGYHLVPLVYSYTDAMYP